MDHPFAEKTDDEKNTSEAATGFDRRERASSGRGGEALESPGHATDEVFALGCRNNSVDKGKKTSFFPYNS